MNGETGKRNEGDGRRGKGRGERTEGKGKEERIRKKGGRKRLELKGREGHSKEGRAGRSQDFEFRGA